MKIWSVGEQPGQKLLGSNLKSVHPFYHVPFLILVYYFVALGHLGPLRHNLKLLGLSSAPPKGWDWKPCLYGPYFVHMGTVMLQQKLALPKLYPQSWKNTIVYNVFVCCSITTYLFLETSQNPDKQPHTICPLAKLTVGTIHWGRIGSPAII